MSNGVLVGRRAECTRRRGNTFSLKRNKDVKIGSITTKSKEVVSNLGLLTQPTEATAGGLLMHDYTTERSSQEIATVGFSKKSYAIARETNFRCWYCGSELINEICIDHIIPKSRGGSNDRSNLRACCRPCNTKKGVRSVEEFRVYLEGKKPIYQARNHILSALELASTPYDADLIEAVKHLNSVAEPVLFYGETLSVDGGEA